MLTSNQISKLHLKLLLDLSKVESKALSSLGLCQLPTFKTHHITPLIDVDLDSMIQLMELMLHQLDTAMDATSEAKPQVKLSEAI